MKLRLLSESVKGLVTALLLSSAANVLAADVTSTVYPEQIMITSDNTFGGCMVLFTGLSLATLTPTNTCSANGWVSFGCAGDQIDAVRAYRMLDQVQLALAAGKRVQVTATDTVKYNNVCMAKRIYILK
jgi:hypothetical protein